MFRSNISNCIEAEDAAWLAKPKVYRLKHSNVTSQQTVNKKNTLEKTLIEEYNPSKKSIKSISLFSDSTKKSPTIEEQNRAARFFTFGCQGDGNAAQLDVAKKMNTVLSDPNVQPPDFILLLGDNFYDYGVSSADDNIFKTNFYDIYSRPELGHLRKIPCFVLLGNHDENIHKLGKNINTVGNMVLGSTMEKGVHRGMHQVAHSYFPHDERYKTTEQLKELYRSHTDDDSIIDLNLNELPNWNMPNRIYSLICENTQIFCIDSNTYVSDYLSVWKGDNNKYNQVLWLQREVNKARKEGRQVILALHHPIITPGKRAFESDIDLYFSEEEIKSDTFRSCFLSLLFEMKGKQPSYNQLMHETLKKQQLEFDLILTAHDHDMYYYNNKNTQDKYKLCQVTSGGGGGKLQNREDFSKQKNLGCFLKTHGFTEVNCPANEPIEFFLHSLPKAENEQGFLLHFNSDDPIPIKNEIDKDSEAIRKLYSAVKNAIENYLQYVASQQAECKGQYLGKNVLYNRNVKHGHTGVERVHNIWAYISNYEADDYITTVKNVYLMSRWDSEYTSPSQHSFITILNDEIEREYGVASMEELYKETEGKNLFVNKRW